MSGPTGRFALRAKWVYPVSRPPIAGGVVEIADGKIERVGAAADGPVVDLGDVAIVPGLVNAHTHLEFSNLEQPLGPPRPFAKWIGAVVRERRRRRTGGPKQTVTYFDGETVEYGTPLEPDPLMRGLRECLATGSAAVGEIATNWLSNADDQAAYIDAINRRQAVYFREIFCPFRRDDWRVSVDTAYAHAEDMQRLAHAGLVGVCPHAPYSVDRRIIRAATRPIVYYKPHLGIRRTYQFPVAMHLAETREEMELLSHGTGPLVDMLDRRGMWNREAFRRGTRAMDYLRILWFAKQVMIIHGNYLKLDELAFLGRWPHMTLVYCPRTHRYFGHPRYPLEAALKLGVRVALGTDSRASNPDLNLWEEARTVAAAFPGVDPQTVLQLATRNGAEALGLEESHGVLEPGRPAHLAVIQLPSGASRSDALFERENAVCGAMHFGEWTVSPPEIK